MEVEEVVVDAEGALLPTVLALATAPLGPTKLANGNLGGVELVRLMFTEEGETEEDSAEVDVAVGSLALPPDAPIPDNLLGVLGMGFCELVEAPAAPPATCD